VRSSMVLLLLFLLACRSEPPAPVEPAWGKQSCSLCGAKLEEPRPSAQALLADGSRTYFDDVGCLASWLNSSGEKPAASWVRSTDDKTWVDAMTVRYAAGHRTPQGYGFLSADKGLSFRELRIVAREKPDLRPPAQP
jgi:nitrous oxide reductase accessory protein NosL